MVVVLAWRSRPLIWKAQMCQVHLPLPMSSHGPISHQLVQAQPPRSLVLLAHLSHARSPVGCRSELASDACCLSPRHTEKFGIALILPRVRMKGKQKYLRIHSRLHIPAIALEHPNCSIAIHLREAHELADRSLLLGCVYWRHLVSAALNLCVPKIEACEARGCWEARLGVRRSANEAARVAEARDGAGVCNETANGETVAALGFEVED